MFDLTKNHKGDILISGAASKYSGSWTIFEAREAVGPRGPREVQRPGELAGLPAPTPSPAWGRPAHALLSTETDPGSLNNLYSQLRKWGRGASPSHREGGENSGRGLINHTEIPAKWLCSFCFHNQRRQTHGLPWPALAGAWRGGGRGGSPCSGETCQLLGLVRRQRRQTQCCCCWFDL